MGAPCAVSRLQHVPCDYERLVVRHLCGRILKLQELLVGARWQDVRLQLSIDVRRPRRIAGQTVAFERLLQPRFAFRTNRYATPNTLQRSLTHGPVNVTPGCQRSGDVDSNAKIVLRPTRLVGSAEQIGTTSTEPQNESGAGAPASCTRSNRAQASRGKSLTLHSLHNPGAASAPTATL
jgi:hypothetical protein